MSIITLTDTIMSTAVKMSEGNPGALTVIMLCIKDGDPIDPDAFMGGFGKVLSLDTLELYGPAIWRLYKDVCGQDLRVMFAVLRAWQLGFITEQAIRSAVVDGPRSKDIGIDVPALVKQVEDELPKFMRASKSSSQQ